MECQGLEKHLTNKILHLVAETAIPGLPGSNKKTLSRLAIATTDVFSTLDFMANEFK